MQASTKLREGRWQRWIITLTVLTGSVMGSINASSVNVALPYMQGNLGASTEEITWVSTGYILSNVIIMPLVAWFSGRFGRKRFYMGSVLLFISSSILCGMAWDLPSIIAFRILQGIGGGTLVPVAQAVLRETFPPEEQGMAMGIYGFGVVFGPALGPTLGGWVTDHYSWPWIFYLNIPVGVVNLLLAARFLHDPSFLRRETGRMDLAGVGLIIIGFGSLQLMLERGEVNDWFASNFIVTLAIIAAVGIVLFVIRELTAAQPAVNLWLLRDSTFAGGNVLSCVLGMGLFAGLFLMPMFLQKLLDYPALDAGLAMVPRALAMGIAMVVGGRFYNSTGPLPLVGVGFLITALSFWQLSRMTLTVGYWDIFFPQLWQGAGIGMVFVGLSTASLMRIPKPDLTAATGLYNFFRQIFGSIGIAVVASRLTRGGNLYRAILTEHVTEYDVATAHRLGGAAAILGHSTADTVGLQERACKLLDGIVTKQGSLLAFNHVYMLIAVLFTAVIPFIFLLRQQRPAATPGAGGKDQP